MREGLRPYRRSPEVFRQKPLGSIFAKQAFPKCKAKLRLCWGGHTPVEEQAYHEHYHDGQSGDSKEETAIGIANVTATAHG